jgi:hypothetical protein
MRSDASLRRFSAVSKSIASLKQTTEGASRRPLARSAFGIRKVAEEGLREMSADEGLACAASSTPCGALIESDRGGSN